MLSHYASPWKWMCLRHTVLHDAPSCPWRQPMLRKMTKLAEISPAFSSRAEQFFNAMKSVGLFVSTTTTLSVKNASPNPIGLHYAILSEAFALRFSLLCCPRLYWFFLFSPNCITCQEGLAQYYNRDSVLPSACTQLPLCRSVQLRGTWEEPGEGFGSPPFLQPPVQL